MSTEHTTSRRHAMVAILAFALLAGSAGADPRDASSKLDTLLQQRARSGGGGSRVIVQFRGELDLTAVTRRGGVTGRTLRGMRGVVAHVSNRELSALAADARVERVWLDRPAFATLERTGATIGATLARDEFGLSGAGIGVAVIDSGVTGTHADLSHDPAVPELGLRIVHFRDFTAGSSDETPYDDNGHGTHVAGIIAGNGYESSGRRTGVAPGANIIGLKVLDSAGRGYISNVIAALDHALSLRTAHNIRIINLSVGSAVNTSYDSDPLTQAAKRAVDAGIVVVAAVGNLGRRSDGTTQYGAVTSPGNAPWVLTVGASSHQGTTARGDDTVPTFSSRGPTYIDYAAKPDLVAPGVGIESLIEPSASLYYSHSGYLLDGTNPSLPYKPYLSLSGTSMAAPVVAGTVALMLEANPRLTPNAVKGLLQYTAQTYAGYDALTQGAGFLNARGAIRMARFFADPHGGYGVPSDPIGSAEIPWSRHLIWGNYRMRGGVPLPGSNAWTLGVRWGAKRTGHGERVVWGAQDDENIVWSTDGNDNIVWSTDGDENIVWSTDDEDNIVWSTDGDENIVWSTDCGGANCHGVVWGSDAPDGTLWGTAESDDNIVWSTDGDDNIVWSTDGDDNIVWSTEGDDNIVWSTGTVDQVLWSRPSETRPGRGRARESRR